MIYIHGKYILSKKSRALPGPQTRYDGCAPRVTLRMATVAPDLVPAAYLPERDLVHANSAEGYPEARFVDLVPGWTGART